MFNATVFSNLGNEYGEIVSASSVNAAHMSFPELLDVLTGHEAHLQMRSPPVAAAIHLTTESQSTNFRGNFPGGNRDFHVIDYANPLGRGRGSKRNYNPDQRRDPCPVCGSMTHFPYK